jgi:hypothetical protein
MVLPHALSFVGSWNVAAPQPRVKEPGIDRIDNLGSYSVVWTDKESDVKDNMAWLVELFLMVLALAGAVSLGLASTLFDIAAAGILSIVLFIICLAVGVFFATGQDERLRTVVFGGYVLLASLLFIFTLTLQGVDARILSPLLG